MTSTFHFQVASCKNIFMKYLGTDSSATFANHPDELDCLSTVAAWMKMSRKQH